MNFKRILVCAAVVVMCGIFSACGDSEKSSSKEETGSASAVESTAETESAASPAGTTDYDVNGDFRAFDELKEIYGEGYTLNVQIDYAGNIVDMSATVSGDKAYMSTVSAGMKSYSVVPGDGKVYSVYEATTTYSVDDAQENSVAQLDILFGATADFSSAEIDAETNTVYEHYSLNTEISESQGEIIYGFDGSTYDLTSIQIAIDGIETPDLYTVTSVEEADTSVLEVPDVSSYSQL